MGRVSERVLGDRLDRSAPPETVGRGPTFLSSSPSGIRLVLVATGVTVASALVALARAISDGWVPVGDNGLLAVRAHDVFSDAPPLLGTWSSASGQGAIQFNHPGPLLFDFFALPAALFGRAGLAVGAVVLNIVAILGIVYLGHRRGGIPVAAVTVAVTGLLCWSMGSQLLYDPWSPNSLLLPFLAFLLAVWSAHDGDLPAFVLVLALGTFILQTNLGYGLLVPVLAAWALFGLVPDLRRRRVEAGPQGQDALGRRTRRWTAVGAVVLVVGWGQTVLEQFIGDGDGNLVLLWRGLGQVDATLSPREVVRLSAGVFALPPTWLWPSMRTVYGNLPGPWTGLLLLGGLALIVGLCLVDARRRHDRMSSSALATGAVGAVLGILTISRTPTSDYDDFAPYQTRLLWPLAAFLTLAVLLHLVRRWTASSPARGSVAVGALSVVAVVAAALNLPHSSYGTDAPDFTQPVVRDLLGQLPDLDQDETLYFDWQNDGTRSETYVNHYGSALLAELRRRDIPFVSDNEMLLSTIGEERRYTGDNADLRLTVRTGDGADEPPPGGRRVALHLGLRQSDRERLSDLRSAIAGYIADDRLRLTETGEEALARLNGRSEDQGSELDVDELFRDRGLVGLIRRGFLDLDDDWRVRFQRYADLQERSDLASVGVFLTPLDGPGAGS